LAGITEARNAEIEHFDLLETPLRQVQVAGLDVPMHDACLVSHAEGLRHEPRHVHRFVHSWLPQLKQLVESEPVEPLHGDEWQSRPHQAVA